MLALALIVASQPALAPALLYERTGILRGEYWRLWTGHLVHFGPSHLVWNLLIFALAAVWAERLAPVRTRILLAVAPGVIGLALLALDPALQTYAGLSGVVAAALAFLAFTQLTPPALAGPPVTIPARPSDRWFWRGVLALILLKIAAEFAAEQPLFARFSVSGIRTVPLAHLAGFLVASTVHRARRRPPA
ncbi:MAG: rhombosortase [Undibacterium sp.]|nr:rhombosortase [Opitutaceae bacterium]